MLDLNTVLFSHISPALAVVSSDHAEYIVKAIKVMNERKCHKL